MTSRSRSFASVCLLVAVGAAWMASRLAAQVALGVMTFNVRTANIPDGDNAWANRKTLVVDTIERFAPQVAGLQEVVREQIEFFEDHLSDYRWLGIDRGLNNGEGLSEYTPIFYRYAELSPIESGNFWLSPPPDLSVAPDIRSRGSRIVTWARFHHHATGRQLYVFNTHFSPRGGQGHLAAAEIIKTRLREVPAGVPVVVTGDFNAPAETSDLWRVLAADGLRDAWMAAPDRRGPPVTMGSFGPPPEGDTTRIDWILVGPSIRVRSVETVLHNDHGRYPSDHYPVFARVDVE
jgi:endonuclease/exonuclease/phosphatase family metal-dependent hydrolase